MSHENRPCGALFRRMNSSLRETWADLLGNSRGKFEQILEDTVSSSLINWLLPAIPEYSSATEQNMPVVLRVTDWINIFLAVVFVAKIAGITVARCLPKHREQPVTWLLSTSSNWLTIVISLDLFAHFRVVAEIHIFMGNFFVALLTKLHEQVRAISFWWSRLFFEWVFSPLTLDGTGKNVARIEHVSKFWRNERSRDKHGREAQQFKYTERAPMHRCKLKPTLISCICFSPSNELF